MFARGSCSAYLERQEQAPRLTKNYSKMRRARRDSDTTLVDSDSDRDVTLPLLAQSSVRHVQVPNTRLTAAHRPTITRPRVVIPARPLVPAYGTFNNTIWISPQEEESSSLFLWRVRFWFLAAIGLHAFIIVCILKALLDPGVAVTSSNALGLALLVGTCEFGILWALFICQIASETSDE